MDKKKSKKVRVNKSKKLRKTKENAKLIDEQNNSIQPEINERENNQNLSNPEDLSSNQSQSTENEPTNRIEQRQSNPSMENSNESNQNELNQNEANQNETNQNEGNQNESDLSKQTKKSNQSTNQKKSITSKKRRLARLEKPTDELISTCKTTVQPHSNDGFSPYDRVRPTYLLKEMLNTHNLDDILKLYILILKDRRTCPFLLSKTGYLLLRKFIQTKPGDQSELCNDLVSFVKFIKYFPALPTAEFFLDFMVFCYESNNEQLIEQFGNLKDHVSEKKNHLNINQMKQCFESFLVLISFKEFFKEFIEDGLDHERYLKDEFKSKDFIHIGLRLKKLTIDQNSDYPLDFMLLCYIDLLVLFKKTKEAKNHLLNYHKRYPTNLNAIIYILKFNELYTRDKNLFKEFYNKLIILDASNKHLIDYIGHVCLPVERLKILLCYVDYTMNKDDPRAWKLIYDQLTKLETMLEEKNIKEFYGNLFESYWPKYHFSTVSIKINRENCDLIFHKAFTFNYFQPECSVKFVAQIKLILALAKSDKIHILNSLL